MQNFALDILLNHSIIIAAFITVFRLKPIFQSYYPFIFFIWLGLVNETLSLLLIYKFRSNTANSNVYVLFEYCLILLQFYKWQGIKKAKLYVLISAGLLVWTGDNLILNSISTNNSIFRIFYSFIIVFLSIDQISKIIVNERGNLLKNAMFLICIAFLTYYGCKAFIEVFNAFHLGFSDTFNRNIFMILYFANLFSNIVYAIAILCIPTKQEFSLQY